jgi:hypothetical protein
VHFLRNEVRHGKSAARRGAVRNCAGLGQGAPGIWFISYATELAIVATGLIFTAAVRRSQALRLPMPQFDDFPEEDEDFAEEED